MNTVDLGPLNSFQAKAFVADLEKNGVNFKLLSAESLECTLEFGQYKLLRV